jgi:exodeoxyribonuclease VII small subunit
MTYEEAVAELETLIDRMESGETPLEESLADYERGVGLLKRCRAIISQAEQKIEYLKASAESADEAPVDDNEDDTAR